MNLYIMCGPSGSGKSTWIQNQMKEKTNSIWCSRDKARFSLLKEEDDYFSKEDEAYILWIEQIQKGINNKVENIYIDATHLTQKARNQMLDSICLNEECNLIPVNFMTTAEQCIANNENRTGRAYVPRSVIKRMHSTFIPATYKEKYNYKNIISFNGGDL